jgi:thiosulfate dehydrogenase
MNTRKINPGRVHFWGVLGAAMVASAVLAAPLAALADDTPGSLARGGKLYDRWYKVVGADAPADTHPSYPSAGKAKGASTWRCKECHGWDYLGKDGAYAKGSHFSGIKGVNGMAGASPDAIIAVLKDATHGYTDDMMGEEDFHDLANFVSAGQVDMDALIERASKAPKGGDHAKGAGYFNTICAGCHREDGTRPKDMDKPLGAQMGNPWEVLHKIQNGQPGEPMPALRALDMQIALDLMAHIATLPKEK